MKIALVFHGNFIKMNKFLIIFLAIGLFLPSLILAQGSGALQFDGYLNREDYVDIGNNSVFRFGTGDFTLEAWVKFTTNWSGLPIIDAIAGDWSVAYAMEAIAGKLSVFTYDDSSGDEGIAISPNLYEYNDGNWHHVVGVREDNFLYLYVDGILVDTGEEPNPINVSHESNLSFAYSPANNNWFESSIDEVRIYNRGISANEASEHYSGEYDDETGLVGLWHFDEMEGSIAYDSSGYGNDGTIYGATWIEGVTIGSTEGTEGLDNANPIVRLKTSIAGTYNKTLSINYSVSDSDIGKGGLKSRPITIFYSDDKGRHWQKIAEDQLNTGVYDFDTTKVPDGTNYKIRVVALDGYDYPGHKDSKPFAIDNTGPTFDIAISPSSVREKDTITLRATSSEELRNLPEIKITQAGAEPAMVQVGGSGREFSASYYVTRGYGEAVISISGEDLAGNIGKTITAGGNFFVEYFGPPPPIIREPVNNQVFSESAINIIGTSQLSTEVILNQNGITKFTTKPSVGGDFNIDIFLSEDNKGYNTLSTIAINEKGEGSGEVTLEVKLNRPPEILMTSVFEEIISDEKEISWTASDLNDDELVFSVEYSNDEGITWDSIVSDFSETSYKMDTTQLADGPNYFVRVVADDGTKKVSDISERFAIKNNLPHIALDIPLSHFTSVNTPVFTGKITGSEEKITSAEYSLDKGKTWQKASASDGEFNSLTEKIEIPISNPLEDGKYSILIKAVDALSRSVKISRSFNIDTVPPVTDLPLLDKVIDDSMDTNLELDGLQIVFHGETEAEAEVELALGKETYKATADERGKFEIRDVTLEVHGPNELSLLSSDLANNTSWIDGIVISNNPPQVSIFNPKEGEFLTDTAEITWQIQDLDNDSVVPQILYQKKDKEWVALAKGLTADSYNWDISGIINGEYKIKIIVSDGMSEVEKSLNVSIDNIAPQIVLNASGPPLTATVRPTFSGQASDDFSGIQYIEYSFNNVDWYKTLITEGYQTREASFHFRHRSSIGDGDYKIMVRATDQAGNIAYSDAQRLMIDTTPPRPGSILISSGSLILFPDKTGAIKLFKDRPYKVLFSVAKDAKEVILSSEETIFDLNFNKSTLLWESEFNFGNSGDYPLEISTRDELNNSQTKEIIVLKVLPLGRVYNKENNQPIQGAEVTLYVFNQGTNSWLIWDGQAFNQKNPQKTNETGEYGFLAPPGKYQLEVLGSGFGKVKSEEFEVENNYLVDTVIPLVSSTEKKGIINKALDYFTKIIR